jgi:8-amino-7-oxononanoate synthase
MDEIFPERNAHLVVNEAHATGPGGRGMVAQLAPEDRILARLHTFCKALAASVVRSTSDYCYSCANEC